MDQYIERIYFSASGHTDNTHYYFRVVRRGDGWIWNDTAKEFQQSPTWAATAIDMPENGTTGAFPVVIPAAFPASGTVEIVIYARAGSAAVNTDDVKDTFETKIGSIFGF